MNNKTTIGNKQKNKVISIVYLCGPLDGVDKSTALDWRLDAYDKLSSIAVLSLVPGLERKKLSSQQIVDLDSVMIEKCDAILVNLNFLEQKADKRLGTGSLIELGMGVAQKKLIIGFIKNKVLPEHCKFLKGVIKILCENLDEALAFIAEVNSGYIKVD